MSTSTQNVAPHLTPISLPPLVEAKKTRIRQYKPRLSNVVKNCLEDSVRETRQAQNLLGDMLDWLEAEVKRREELRTRISQLAPLDHRMATLLEEEKESLLSIGSLYPLVARMALTITALDRNLSETLERAKDSAPPPQNRARERQVQS